jgi:hypothetical protein
MGQKVPKSLHFGRFYDEEKHASEEMVWIFAFQQ